MREFVRRRANDRCEYCLIPQAATAFLTFHVEHIVPRQHGGSDELDNLAFACNRCNAYKGQNLSAIDPITEGIFALFRPRHELWNDHFELQGGEIVGRSPTGRATVRLLNMNAPHRVELREEWLREGGGFV